MIVLWKNVQRPLTPQEADGNFEDLDGRLAQLESGLAVEGIGEITVEGDVMTIIGDRGTQYGAFQLPAPLEHAGGWQPESAYGVRDVVGHDGASYYCLQNHTSSADFDADLADGKWALLADRGEDGDPAQAIAWRGDWDVATAYVQGDGVAHNGKLYVALTATTGSEPPSEYWEALGDIVSGTPKLGDLADVDLESNGLFDGDILVYDEASGAWVAAEPPSGGGGGAATVEFSSTFLGKPTAGGLVAQYVAAADWLELLAAESSAYANTPVGAGGSTVSFDVLVDDTVVGTIDFAPESKWGSFNVSGFPTVQPSGVVQVVAPDPADPDLADISVTLRFFRTA
jgi:hypothetical protein